MCGRDLHSDCLAYANGSCCGSTSLCPKIENEGHTGTPGTGSGARQRAVSGQGSSRSGKGSATAVAEPNDSITSLDLDLETEQDRRTGRPRKESDFKDAESTGRKRAAELYPLDRSAACEWQRLADCGGGSYPIVGCIDGKQANRHHGPSKDTLDNSSGNVHRICARCHNLWHEWNDATPADDIPHSPRTAEFSELTQWDNRNTRPKAPNSRYKWHREREQETDD